MPLPRWLLSLLPRKPPQTGAPPASLGGGWGPGPHATSPNQVQPPPNTSPPETGEEHSSPDNSHRIHIAANDPAFAAKREAAVALICAAISDITTPLGYTRKGTTWARETSLGKSAINLQRSRYGFTVTINLRFLTPNGSSPETSDWAQDDDVRLQRFYLGHEALGLDDGEITYLDVHSTPECLDAPMHILKTRALPWLDAHHTAHNHPKIHDFLPR